MKFKTTSMKKILLLVLTMALFNCSKDENDDNSSICNDSEIAFLKEGNTWSYNIKSLGFDNGELTLTIKNCNGEDYSIDRIAKNSSFDELLTGSDLWEETSDFIVANTVGNENAKIYKKNAKLGDTWMYTQKDGGVVTYEVIKMDSIITVPAGTFSCKVYKYNATDIINELFVFWNDEIGQIKENAGFVSLELSNYSVD